ncbi:hypothetical protein PCANC_04231 [Puccinia coronata f. sp. avenae]|uniref:Uncharacterized protein n=1 Tax=Puccinia coronata f. sp. avenae TaxID=200324 RepID=A0A2N5VX84_9BASI|nr:hypothetical protein PCANC_04231 [Puccinia coronata f. sp. avenae]
MSIFLHFLRSSHQSGLIRHAGSPPTPGLARAVSGYSALQSESHTSKSSRCNHHSTTHPWTMSQAQQEPAATNSSEFTHLLQEEHRRSHAHLTQTPPSARFFIPAQPHSAVTHFILNFSHSPTGLLSSVALNENDLSVDPVGLDLDLQSTPSNSFQPDRSPAPHRFRKSRFLLTLDIFKAIVLSLQTIYTANQFIGPYSYSDQPFTPYWHKHVVFPLDCPSQYRIHLLTLICAPALHFVLGCSTVLAIHTRRCLGWRSHELFFRSLKLGLSLLLLNQLLMSQTIFQTRGKVILTTLPIWSLGWNLIFITAILIALFLAERTILNYLYSKTSGCLLKTTSLHGDDDGDEDLETRWMRRCADRIRVAIDAFLVTSTVFLPLVIGYMLPGDREDPDPDWWIESSLTRSYWFWFFLAPTPKMSAYPRFGMVTNFAPVGWLPFVLLGAFYGRSLIRKPQERKMTFHQHLKLAIVSVTVFALTRAVDVGNLAVPYIADEGPARAVPGHLFRWLSGSWEMAFYTTAYPPDLGHLSLSSTLIFLLLALLDLLPQALLNLNPLLLFGRSPIFFYSIQLLSFHYVLPSVLAIVDWPMHLNLFWISVVSLSSLPVLWLACEAWVIFKDCKSPQSLWRFF